MSTTALALAGIGTGVLVLTEIISALMGNSKATGRKLAAAFFVMAAINFIVINVFPLDI